MSPRPISPDQFGHLFHGTGTAGITSDLHQPTNGGPRYSAMRKSYGYNYATNDLHTAIQYSRDAARMDGGVPTVYEVAPRRKSESWGPDPDSGPNGFGDGPRNKREALDLHENGSEVSLRFRSPLKPLREVFVEDRAQDVTDTVVGRRSIS